MKKKKRTWQEQLRLLISTVIAGIMVIAFGVILYTVLSVRIKVSDTQGIGSVKKDTDVSTATPAQDPLATGGIVEIQPGETPEPDFNAVPPGGDTPEPTVEVTPAGERAPVQVDFAELEKINTDVAAWLYSEGTDIDYPVVQRNNTYYLNHSFDGKSASRGTLFIHEDNANDFSDENTCIYGHNMTRTGDGVMFSSLVSYKKQSYYEAHPVMYLLTPAGDYKVEIFAAYLIDIFDDRIPMHFGDKEDYQSYLDEIRSRSSITTDVDVTPEDRIVTLITCTQNHESTERYLVAGKLTLLS